MTHIDRRGLLAGIAGAAAYPSLARALSITPRFREGTIRDVDHVVILMQENRSFDHYFGAMNGVRGFSDPHPAPAPPIDSVARDVLLQANRTDNGPDRLYPFALNTDRTFAHMRVEGTPHSWPDAQAAWDEGRMGRWPEAKRAHAMGYFTRADIPFQYAMADAFTLCDGYFCSLHAGTNPNRVMLWSGTIDGDGCRGGPCIGNSHDSLPPPDAAQQPYRWTTYVERLQAAGIDWRIYQDMDDNFTDNPLVGFEAFQKAAARAAGSDPALVERALTTRGLDGLKADVLSGRLPQVSYIIATASGSEHPGPSSPAQGADYTARVIDALTADPEVWARTVLFVNFDENDGFYDHVPPPAPPSREEDGGLRGGSTVALDGEYHLHPSRDDAALDDPTYRGRPYGLGPRVPLYVLSPWSRGGYVNSEVFDHTSVIRFLETRFGVLEPNISPWRRAVCGDLTSCFDFGTARTLHVALPPTAENARRASALGGRTLPPIPVEAPRPEQEPGFRPACRAPYELECVRQTSVGPDVRLRFINAGSRAAVFHVYDRRDLEAGPRRYTVAGGQSFEDVWDGTAGFDLQVMGPDGFHRRYRGSGEARITTRLDWTRPGPVLVLKGAGTARVLTRHGEQFLVVDGERRVELAWDDPNRRYDVTVETPRMLTVFAGRAPDRTVGSV